MATSIESLASLLRREITRLRESANNFGLSELGRNRYLLALARFELATDVDLTAYQQHRIDIRETLEIRLKNVQDLPRAIRETIADSHDAGWLATWLEEAEGDEESGVNPVLSVSPAKSGWILN